MHEASVWEVRGRCVGGAWAVHGVLGRLVGTEGGSADRACRLGCMLGACPLRSGTRGVGCTRGGRGARGYARDDAWERLCTRTCDTLCERPSGMPFICVFVGLHVGQGSPR